MLRVRSWILATAAACLAGCGGPRTVPVKGVVTFDGKPLAKASVMFCSQTPEGRDATGFTDAQGAFTLSTFHPRDGALPGSYKVTVHYSEPIPLPPELKTPAERQRAMAEARKTFQPTIVVPDVYARVDQTPLQHKVPDDGDVKIELHGEPR